MNTGNRCRLANKGKNAKRNRRLALLAGMALSFGVAYGMMTGEVALANDYKLHYINSQYQLTFRNNGSNIQSMYGSFSEALEQAKTKAQNGDTINMSHALVYNLRHSSSIPTISVNNGVTLYAMDASGAYCEMTASAGGASVQYDNSNSMIINGTFDRAVVGLESSSGKIDLNSAKGTLTVYALSTGSSVGTIQLGSKAGLHLGNNGKLNVGTLNVDGGTLSVGSGSLRVDNLIFSGGTYSTSNSGQVTANSVNFGRGINIASNSAIKANDVTFDASDANNLMNQLFHLTISSATQGQAVSVTIKNASSDTTALSNAIKSCVAAGNNVVFHYVYDNEALADTVASMNPFEEKLPSADDIANMNGLTDAQKAKLIAAVQQAGKTAAAPGVTSARVAAAITSVLTNNVVNHTAEIRGFASAVDEGRPEPDKMWFQYKHTQMDVDGGDVYSKSTINTNNFQLGYDTQIGTNDYLGAYIGTTTGSADFNSPARDGRIDIDNSFDFGVYGTHMLPNDQYIDYMVHTGKFDSEYDSSKWGTTDTGAMVGYGAKIAQNDRLTLNPYIQLAYDKISVDSYATRAGNVIKSDDSNNWTAKLGMNLIDASGLYGGVAYSRGLSGSYNAYINGVAMPASDNNANVLYLSLGYRANMARNAVLDLSMEKTFMDYKGWTATGKVNFYF